MKPLCPSCGKNQAPFTRGTDDGREVLFVRDCAACVARQQMTCEVVLQPVEYDAFLDVLQSPPRVIPGLAQLLRAQKVRRVSPSDPVAEARSISGGAAE